MFFIVGRLDDGNSEDRYTVDVDIELGYNVGKNVDNNVGTSDAINELKKVGFDTLSRNDGLIEKLKDGDVLGFTIIEASFGLKVGDALGNDDGLIEGATNGFELGFKLGPEIGIQEGKYIGATLGLRVVDALDNDDGLIGGATNGSILGFKLSP